MLTSIGAVRLAHLGKAFDSRHLSGRHVIKALLPPEYSVCRPLTTLTTLIAPLHQEWDDENQIWHA